MRSFSTTTTATAAATAVTTVSRVLGITVWVDVELGTSLRRLIVDPALDEEGLLAGRPRRLHGHDLGLPVDPDEPALVAVPTLAATAGPRLARSARVGAEAACGVARVVVAGIDVVLVRKEVVLEDTFGDIH